MQVQCNFTIASLLPFFLLVFVLPLPRVRKGFTFRMTADIYNRRVFCVSTEAVGLQRLKCR